MYKVTVVIPLYNKARYLDSMICSLLSQTLSSAEFIFVDDGSTDGSAEIIESYLSSDSRIKLYRQVNSGAGAARNKGIELAQGEYITFFDADDLFDSNMLSEMYEAASACRADICVCSTKVLNDVTGNLSNGVTIPTSLLGLTNRLDRQSFNRYTSFNVVVWNKLFKLDFINKNKIRFQTCRSANDVYFAAASLYAADSITALPYRYVTYRKGITGNLQSKDRDSALDIFVPINELLNMIRKEGSAREIRELNDFAIGSIFQQLFTFGNMEAIDSLFTASFSSGPYSQNVLSMKSNASAMNKIRVLLCSNVSSLQFRKAFERVYVCYKNQVRPTRGILFGSYLRLAFASCKNIFGRGCNENGV